MAEVVGVVALYVATGKLGFFLAIPPGNITVVWPPSGLALAAVLLLGKRGWPGIWVGSFLVNTWFFSGITHPLSAVALAISCSIGVGSTLQALLGAGLIRRFIGSGSPLDRPQDVFTFAGIELFSCMVAATFGVTSLSLARFASWDAYAYTWWTWWLGDLTGVLIVTPLLLTFSQRPRVRWEPRRLAEVGLVLAVLLISSRIVFGEQFRSGAAHYPLEFVLIPFVIWMAFRFGQHGVVLSVFIVSGMSIWGTIHGFGPFGGVALNESLMLLQAFLGIVTVTGLVLAAAILERRRAEEALRTSERRLAGALDVAEAAVISVDDTQRILLFDQSAERIFGYAAQEVLGQPLDLLLPSRFTDAHRQHLRDFAAGAVAARRMGERREVFGRRKDGTEFPAEAAISKLNDIGQITFIAVLRDITERKQAAAALEHAHAKLTGWVTELEQRTRQITLLSEMGDLLQSCLTPEEAY
ncbi:MAG: MASE1 domain-containing protein, partial [candidate division NC10 bacterium]|nr:MASE1 domain-containing protein [candidate division NC10 bacterium]